MGRKLLSIVLVSVLALSIVVFIRYSSQTRRNIDSVPKDEARISMENFTYRKYSGAEREILLSSKVGKVMGDNRIILEGDVSAIKKTTSKSEVITSQQAVAYFGGESFLGHSEEAELEKVEFSENVLIRFRDYVIRSEQATYLAKEQLVVSRVPVEVVGSRRSFTSDQGFRYQIATEDLEMYGNIEGEFERLKRDD